MQASSPVAVVPGSQLVEQAAPMLFHVLSAKQIHSSALQAVQASSPVSEVPGEQLLEVSTTFVVSLSGLVAPPQAAEKTKALNIKSRTLNR